MLCVPQEISTVLALAADSGPSKGRQNMANGGGESLSFPRNEGEARRSKINRITYLNINGVKELEKKSNSRELHREKAGCVGYE